MLSERPTQGSQPRLSRRGWEDHDLLGDSSIVAGAGAGKRACVSESQSIFETGQAFKTKIHSRKRYSVARYVGSSPRTVAKWLQLEQGEAEWHI